MTDRRILTGIISFALCAMQAAPAAAQTPPAASPPAAAPSAAAASPDILVGATCVTAANPAMSRAVVDVGPKTPQERAAAVALLRESERCLHLTTSIVTSLALIRGAAAETLFEAQFPTPVAARTPALGAKPMARPPANSPNAAELESAYALAECSVPGHPELVRALLAANPQSPEEQTAMDGLRVAFAPCVPPGTQLHIDRRGLRSLLAEELYRWSVVQRDGPTSPWAAEPAPAAPATTPAATPATPAPGH